MCYRTKCSRRIIAHPVGLYLRRGLRGTDRRNGAARAAAATACLARSPARLTYSDVGIDLLSAIETAARPAVIDPVDRPTDRATGNFTQFRIDETSIAKHNGRGPKRAPARNAQARTCQ